MIAACDVGMVRSRALVLTAGIRYARWATPVSLNWHNVQNTTGPEMQSSYSSARKLATAGRATRQTTFNYGIAASRIIVSPATTTSP